MKREKYYTFIIAENNSAHLKKITVKKKQVYIFLSFAGALSLFFLAFITDYFGLYVDRWELSRLKKENRQLEQKIVYAHSQLEDLEKKIYQISDFSKKLQMITSASLEPFNTQGGFGKIHSSSAIIALSSHSRQRSLEPAVLNTHFHSESDKLEIRIENLKGQSELVKQNAWTLYTDLLEKQELLNRTPSIAPVKGWISSSFGYRNETIYSDHEPHFHRGVDIASAEGHPVVASADGKVVYTGYDERGYGNLIVIDHGHGLRTFYGHLASTLTKAGDFVQRGEEIGLVGSTGKSTGPHLHYEVRIFDKPVNPENYMLDQNDRLYAESSDF